MIWAWLSFVCFVLLMLGLDLGVFHRKAHVVRAKEVIVRDELFRPADASSRRLSRTRVSR